jgi:PPM family protein phosphatase
MSEAPSMSITSSGRTATGKVRHNNEDNLWAGRVGDADARAGDREAAGSTSYPGFLLAVADGMGGALAGEVASRLAVESLAEEIKTRTASAPSARASGLADIGRGAVLAANSRIREEGDAHRDRRGMGTTLTVAWIVGNAVELFQVGDSRAYLWRGGKLEQLTKDQSLVGKLVEDGILSEEEAEKVAGRHIILQALGSEEALDIVHRSLPLEPGDVLLLCTDGLSGLVKHAAIEQVLKRGGTLDDMCVRLISLAEDEGGTDNVTVLLAKASPE